MKNVGLYLLFLLVVGSLPLSSQKKETFVYAIKGADTLRLDKYEPTVDTPEKRACIVFVFGGGFVNGARDEAGNVEYLERLAENGYVACSIDYRLGLKALDKSKMDQPVYLQNLFLNTISMAVEDLFDATSFIYRYAADWKIDPAQIVANGSSAGALAALNGEYQRCNETELARHLPEGFKYAGVIAFAGAIITQQPGLEWKQSPAPIQLFHGEGDKNVPYNQLSFWQTHIIGSKIISDQLTEKGYPHYFYSVQNAKHEMAGEPMKANIEEINAFMERFVKQGEKNIVKTNVDQLDRPQVDKNVTIEDFIRTNLQP